MTKRNNKQWLLGTVMPAYPIRISSTTDGRQTLPDILQDAFGEKAITVFHRYDRPLGAIIPMDAVRMLAGRSGEVDEATQLRIRNSARNLVSELGIGDDSVIV